MKLQLYFSLTISQQRDSMEVTALCFRLPLKIHNYFTFIFASDIICLDIHKPDICRDVCFIFYVPDADFRIVPDKLQVFEHESVSFHCEGLDGSAQLRGIRNTVQFISACDQRTPVLSCRIPRAFHGDAGEYWCETEGGERSSSVNIAVTAGSVILESPVLPVKEGNDVTLSCSKKATSSDLPADFYKDGLLIISSSTGEFTIWGVSKSDEGLYKCSISDGGESAESWLAVRALHRETCPSWDHSIYLLLLLRTVFTIVMVALLLLLVGLLHCGKLTVTQKCTHANR
ncbi:low affinity immunoglobulin gamma Fc region receptor II-like [Centropristis striata]|uniref:low affinity immunoglobulin gamma Fc region receptor II-like n=1 Tax=Centropristis striata TaxID=184440 RepID=UPI0027DF1CD4|nr:low affinity immunoglobulin gamma Fc region receptor II-like [Centropristis striata]